MAKASKPTPIQVRISHLRQELDQAFLERTEEIDLILTAIFGNFSCLLVGSPGTAKTNLTETIVGQVKDAKSFYWLFSRFTEPNEVFGGIDLNKLKQLGKQVRITIGKLPDANFAIFDEVWNASTAILGTLHRITNEGKFDPGDGDRDVDLRAFFGLSNSFNQAPELNALLDRFIIRKTVKDLQLPASDRAILSPRFQDPKLTVTLSLAEIERAKQEIALLSYSDRIEQIVYNILNDIQINGRWQPSARRKRKVSMIAKAYAYIQGATAVESKHLEVLKHVLWTDPTEQPEKCEKIVMKWANPVGFQINQLRMEAASVVAHGQPGSIEVGSKLEDLRERIRAIGDGELVEASLEYVQDLLDNNLCLLAAKSL